MRGASTRGERVSPWWISVVLLMRKMSARCEILKFKSNSPSSRIRLSARREVHQAEQFGPTKCPFRKALGRIFANSKTSVTLFQQEQQAKNNKPKTTKKHSASSRVWTITGCRRACFEQEESQGAAVCCFCPRF